MIFHLHTDTVDNLLDKAGTLFQNAVFTPFDPVDAKSYFDALHIFTIGP